MVVLLSPSKSMDMDGKRLATHTQPMFLEQSERLIAAARRMSRLKLMAFMDISKELAALNHQRFAEWSPPFTPENARQAMLAFTGDVYDGLDAGSLKARDRTFAQSHLRLLSGLYGLLRPLDLMQPYRLEMGRPLKTAGAKDLYAFWRATITDEINQMPGTLVVNLASQEYAKAVDKRGLTKQLISPSFKDEKNGKLKIISFYAKRARGAMARYIIQNRVTDAAGLQAFNVDGYTYTPELSTPSAPMFTRPAPTPRS